MLTKTQAKIMQLFTANITKAFSIRQVERDLNISYPLIHRAITPLIKSNQYLILNENNLVQLNYQNHHNVLAYVESLRKDELFHKNYAKPINYFIEEVLDKFDQEYFIIILFGSAVESNKPRDYDILFIFENNKVANERERTIDIIASNHSDKFHIQSIGTESVFEMSKKRNQKNVLNELLNKHIIIYGAENFYRLLKHARQ
jgi:hypothetical protein